MTALASDFAAAPAGRICPDSQVPERYARNLSALYARDPQLALRLEALPFSACPLLEPARDGLFTIQVRTDGGKSVLAHSRHRPRQEAQSFVQARLKAPTVLNENHGARSPHTFLVAGLGLGYHVQELERESRDPRVIVAEDDLALIKAAFCVGDFTALLRNGNLYFLTSGDKASVHDTLRPLMADMMLGLQILALPYASQVHAAFQARILDLLRDFMAFARLQMLTLLRNARITYENLLFNLPAYLARPGVEVLRGKAAGYPAILVAAGPSLARHLPLLRELRDRAVVIAVQTVFKTLLAHGIRPHFVTSLDFHEISAQFFRDVAEFGDTILVAEPKANWHVLDTYRGRTHVLHHDLYDTLLAEAAPPRGRIRAGSTVAHLAFYLAEYLGCDPIILVGQDLSYADGFYYPPGMPIEEIWGPELGRFQTVEMKQWERIVRARPILRTVKDVQGRDVYTDEQLFTYAEQFQRDFTASSARVIHAGTCGMQLAGTTVMTLAEAAQQHCPRTLPPGLFSEGDHLEPAARVQAALTSIWGQSAELETVERIAEQIRPLLDELLNQLGQPAQFNRLVARVDELRGAMRHHERIYRAVVGASQVAELRRYSADREIRQDTAETPELARRRLERDCEFVTAFLDGCRFLRRVLPEAAQRLEARCP